MKKVRLDLKTETEDDTVLLKEVSDIPCELVRVKEEPITEDDTGAFQGPAKIAVTPVKVKEEVVDVNYEQQIGKENSIDALQKIEQECARIQRENSTVSETDISTILSPSAIQQQVQNVIHVDNNVTINTQAKISENSSVTKSNVINSSVLRSMMYVNNNSPKVTPGDRDDSKRGKDSVDVETINDFDAGPGCSVDFCHASVDSSDNKSANMERIVVKQDLNVDSDEDDDIDDGGEYMVLAEWTDGKLEEAGTTVQDKENGDEKEQSFEKRKVYL